MSSVRTIASRNQDSSPFQEKKQWPASRQIMHLPKHRKPNYPH